MNTDHTDRVMLYAMRALSSAEMADMDAHLVDCARCRKELAALRPVVDSLADWPADALAPTDVLWGRLARRIADETGREAPRLADDDWQEPGWKDAAPGLRYQLLACDPTTRLATMRVRLDPGCEYPCHTHAGVEELHLLEGELWIDERKLVAGDYNRAEPGTRDERVWSETGCTCVLITSYDDALE